MSKIRRTPLAIIASVSAVAALAACGSKDDTAAGTGGPIKVEASDTACKVSASTANAGNVTFQVTNSGSKITEFYVYAEGNRIMGEVENIAPGLNSRLIVNIADAGKYQTACKPGMTGDGIRSDFTVTGGAAPVTDVDALKAQATKSYVDYVTNNATALEAQTAKFVALVKAGDVAGAKAAYAPTRVYYERIEPVAEKFGDLDPLVDAREADLTAGQKFTGYHRLEKDLWKTGLQPDSSAIADQLLTNTQDLVAKTKAIQLTPLDLANGAKSLLDEVATSKITGEEETFSHTDLWDFQANVDGSQAAINALRPILQKNDAALLTSLDAEFKNVDGLLTQQVSGDGFKLYTELSPDQIKTFASAVDGLSEPLSKVAEVVSK